MKLIGVDRVGNRLEKTHIGDGKVVVETIEDAQPALDRNKRAYNDASTRYGKGDMHKVASFPFTVLEAHANAHKIPWREFIGAKSDRAVKAWNLLLNDRDLRGFRTRPGRVDVRKR